MLKTALLFVDIQNDYFPGGKRRPNTQKTVEKVRY